MRVDTPTFAGPAHDQVHPEGRHAELASQRLEALAAVSIQGGERDVTIAHRVSLEPQAIRPARCEASPLRNINVAVDTPGVAQYPWRPLTHGTQLERLAVQVA